MRKRLLSFATALSILGIPGLSFADPIRLISFEQFALADGFAYFPSGLVADWESDIQQNSNHLTASAQATHGDTTTMTRTELVSSISPDLHLLSGTANSSANIVGLSGVGFARSTFGAVFELDTAHAYDFSATFEAAGFFGGWQAILTSSPGIPSEEQLLFMFISNFGKQLEVQRQGLLPPGRYGFLLVSAAGGDTLRGISPSSSSNVDFALQLAPTPEPGSMVLVGGGAAVLLARIRSRRPKAVARS